MIRNTLFRITVLHSLLFFGVSPSSWAIDSTHFPMGKQVSASTHSFVLAAGTGPFVQGDDQMIGATAEQCQAGSSPQVATSLSDAGDSQNDTLCPLASFHAVNPYVKANGNGGYAIYIGFANINTPIQCRDRGASLNWTVYCIKTPVA